MATSGNFLTSDSGQGGGNFYGRLIFEWWETGSGISGSVGYHNISYHLKTYGGSTSYYQYLYQPSMNVDGQGYSWGTTKAYGGGATSFGDYGKTLYTDSNGNRSFGASAQGGIYYNTINTSGSGSWSLNNIPLHAVLTSLSMDAGGIPATDEGPMWLEFSNPSGTAVKAFIESPPGGAGRIFTSGNIGSRYNFVFDTTLKNALQASSPNSNTFTFRVGIFDTIGGTHYDYRDRTMTIKNDAGQANPTFTDFTYRDTNSATVAVTGDNQVLIQGLSNLEVTVPVASKATPNKFATMSSYTTTIGSYSQSDTYSSSVDVVRSVGAVSDVTGSQTLSVRAIDSRGNSKTATKTVTVLPYNSPGFYGGLDVAYSNSFDASDGLTIALFNGQTLGSVSPLTLNGTDLNVPSTTTGAQFDISKNDNSHFTGTWTNITTTNMTDHSGFINTNPTTLASSILSRMAALGSDNTTPWFVRFKVTDAFQTKFYDVIIDVGRPILRIGRDGHLYHNEIEMSQAFNNKSMFLVDGRLGVPISGSWGYATLTGFLWAWSNDALTLINTPGAVGDALYYPVFLPVGTYNILTSFVGTTNAPISAMYIAGGNFGSGVFQYSTDNYSATTTENTFNLTNMVVENAGIYYLQYNVTGKNAASTGYLQRICGIKITKTA